MIIFNLKTFPESTGDNARNIVSMLESLIVEGTIQAEKFSVAPSVLDIVSLRKEFRRINLISQNVVKEDSDSSNQWMTPENLIENEISFSIYNHSENRSFGASFVEDIKEIQNKGVSLVVCVENLEEATAALEAKAFGVAYEPRDLIGSGVSVSTREDVVREFVRLVDGKAMPFIGAGVTTGDDVLKCMELGAKGVLLASAFVKATDKKAKAIELLSN